jgi:uncharacterized protein YchJ
MRRTVRVSAAERFVVRCRMGGRPPHLHEASDVVREEGRCYYVDGDLQ